jgi:membrane protein
MGARLAAVPDLFNGAAVAWVNDYAQSMGAALAFYTMFSIVPLLLIVIAIAGVVFGEEAARGEIYGQLQGMLGSSGAAAVQNLLESAGKPAQSMMATAFGLILLFVGATSVFAELQDAFDRIWRAPVKPGASSLWRIVRGRLLSFGIVLGLGFLLMVSLVLSAALAALSKWWEPAFGGWERIAESVDVVLGVALSTLVFALIFKTMPRVRVAWMDVWIGAILTSLLFVAGKYVIGAYLARSTVFSLFGAAASLVLVLLWVYYSAQIFLFGVEFTRVYALRFGSRRAPPGPTEPAPMGPT